MGKIGVWIMKSFRNKIIAGVSVIIAIFGLVFLTSFTTIKLSLSDVDGSKTKTQVAKEIVGQLADQYLTPKFNAMNERLDALDKKVTATNDWTAKKDDKECKAFIKLLEKQYEKYNKDRLDIKTADLREIDENWSDLPDKYKTAMVMTYYKTAMDYYATIKK
jgi:hypothetical protein